MKFIVQGPILVPLMVLDELREVREFGDWDNRKYEVLGEVKLVTPVADTAIVCGDEAEKAKNEDATKQLEETRDELAFLRLDISRKNAIHRFAGQINKKHLETWADAIEYVHSLDQATIEDVRKWTRLAKEKG